jgi:hypothetical protein
MAGASSSRSPELPSTRLVRDIRPTARIYGIDITDLFVIAGAFLVIWLAVSVIVPPVIITIDIGSWFGAPPMPGAPTWNLVPWVPAPVLWVCTSLLYLVVIKNKPQGWQKDVAAELYAGTERLQGRNTGLWEVGPDTEIDAYELED